MIRKTFKILMYIVVILLLIVIAYLVFMTITDYKPEEVIDIEIENNQKDVVKLDKEMTLTTYNIGYCGMDEEIHFFMDGGSLSRSISKEKTEANLKGSIDALKEINEDFTFLQEVDINATRSYKVDQYEEIKNEFKDFTTSFAINYKTPWVPIPLTKPHGKVLAGLMNLSKYKVDESTRYSLPGQEKWPRQLAELDRCILVNRIPVENSKELVLINVHLSAYDKGGFIRKQQLGFLQQFLKEEYDKGNYVIAGGDFNHQIPGSDPEKFEATEEWPSWLQMIPNEFLLNGYKWKFDENTPTVRTAGTPYVKGENFRAIIDGFIVSENIKTIDIKGKELDFKYSDHNPLTIKFKLS